MNFGWRYSPEYIIWVIGLSFFDMSVCNYCAKYNSLEEDSEKKILVL